MYKRQVEVLIEKGIKLGDMELLSGYKKRMDVENIKQKEAVQKLGISVWILHNEKTSIIVSFILIIFSLSED